MRGNKKLYTAIYRQPYTAIQNYTEICRLKHSYTGPYTAIQTYTGLYTAKHSYIRLYRAVMTCTGIYTAKHGYTRLSVHSYTNLISYPDLTLSLEM